MPKKKIDLSNKLEGTKPKKRRRAQIVVGHTVDEATGKKKPIKKYPSASSLDKLAEKKKELRRIHGAGGPGEMADILFKDYAKKWLDGKEGEVTDNSLIAYKSRVKHLLPLFGEMQVRSILHSDSKIAFAKLKKTVKSAKTRSGILTCYKAIMSQAQDDNIRPDNPAKRINIEVDKEPKRRALTDEETEAAKQFITAHSGEDIALLIAILYYTNCRRGEIFGLQWKHIDFKKRKIKVCQQLIYDLESHGAGIITPKLKTGNSYRDIPMSQQLYEVLNPLRGTPKTYLFQIDGRHYTPWEAELLCLSITIECPELEDVTPHYFRHNYATLMYLAGVPIKEAAQYMGESVKVMLETYVHIEKEIGVKKDSPVYDIFSNVAKTLPKDSCETPKQ